MERRHTGGATAIRPLAGGTTVNRLTCFTVATPLACVMLTCTPAHAFDEELQTIPTRPGVTQAFLLVKPASRPVASVSLFAGGDGRLALSDRGIGSGRNNFLVRTRALFADRGFLVALVDAPSDHARDGIRSFRTSEAHAQDIAGVIASVKQHVDAPVCLIGTSAGTLSAANAAARIRQGMGGLVLASAITRRATRAPDSLMDVDLQNITVPTLLVHHKYDTCLVTPYADIPAVMQRLIHAPKVELVTFEGGDMPRSDPCQNLSYHGFLGIEPAVVAAIARWVKTTAGVE